MSRPTEEDFVNEGLTDDERASVGAEPQQELAASSDPAQQQQEPPPQEEQKTVDVRALQEARAEARAAREEAARIRDERIRLEERLNVINQSIAAQQKQAAVQQTPSPSMDDDPLGYFKHELDAVRGELKASKEIEAQRAQAQHAEQQFNELANRAGSVIAQAARADPKVNEALDFAFEGLRAEIRASVENAVSKGMLPPHMQMAEAERIWRASIANLSQRVTADPQQAADFVFRQARYYGWGTQPQQQAPMQQQNTPNPAELAARQERHMSLSNIQGGEAPQALTLDAIGKMSDDEFNALARKLGDKGLDKLMGAA